LEGHPRDRLERQLTLTDATLLVVASVIGAGIFFTPGRVAELLPHPGWILAAWVVGGLLSLAGALANAELGAMFPRAGGDYVYLREGIHPVAGFLVGWLTFFAIYAGTIAALSAAFAEAIASRYGLAESNTLALAIGVTAAVSLLNYLGVRWGAWANNLTSVLKIAALLAFVVLGPLVGAGEAARLVTAPVEATISFSAFGLAMSPVLFTYLGWNASLYVASEIKQPARTIPRSLFLGLGLCGALYLLVNGIYLYAIPMEALSGASDAAELAAANLFGTVGGTVVALFVLVSVLGTLNANILVGPRIAYAMALDGLFFRRVDRVHPRFGTPATAVVLQGIVAVALLLILGSFPRALDFTTFAILLATMGDMAALYRLRFTQPDRERPYRAWGYPVIPGLYLASTAAIAVAMIWGRPLECAVSVGMLLAGLPFYWFFTRGERADDS
jgi:APA family basic amino acid/polyamine antiporter